MSDFVSTESKRCLHCKKPQCVVGCPIGYDIPHFLSCAELGDFVQANKTVGHLFGEICGYVCPRDKQCKGSCVLGKKGTPVDVGKVEREVFAKSFPVIYQRDSLLSHLKVAVVGGGVSGLTFAEKCFGAGAKVTVFERAQLLHTLKSIPSFRLPTYAVNRVVKAVENSGIKVERREITYDDVNALTKEFDLVYLATGVSVPNAMWIEGEQLATTADEFLRGNAVGDVLVVGGGNTAMDCARLNVHRGGNSVVAYRRTRNDMPAFNAEVDCAVSEGVKFCFNLAPKKAEMSEGKIVVTFVKTVSEGRGKLVETNDTVQMLCDILVVATGSKFDKRLYPVDKFLPITDGGQVVGNLFAGGDATGKSLVAEAVSDALKAFAFVLKKYQKNNRE